MSAAPARRPRPASARPKATAKKNRPVKAAKAGAEPGEPSAKELTEADIETKPAQSEEITKGYDGNTALTLYMREVGQVRLLTAEEEIELAKKIKKGNAKAREMM